MQSQRITRINELLKRELATVLYREMAGESFDFAAVTVTHVETSPDLRQARVLVSVRGDDAEASRVFRHLNHHRGRLQDLCHRAVKLKYTPVFRFERDLAIERGDRVLALLSEMEPAADDAAPDPRDAPRSPGADEEP
ncbi:MAG: 30S ribosome-binding factor RbfA [Lentisphaerae bacterium]|nr:30S ribosome-binding factor RbfA [Lentisphaerota bacterium]